MTDSPVDGAPAPDAATGAPTGAPPVGVPTPRPPHTDESAPTGRRAELATLVDALELARTGQGQLAVLVGESGSGKTHLLRELAAHARRAGALVLSTTCTPDSAPLTPWKVLSRAGQAAIGDQHAAPVGDLVSMVTGTVQGFRGKVGWALIVLDDIQSADHASVDVLRTLAPMLTGDPVLLVVAGRPGAVAFDGFADLVVELAPLTPDDLAEWLGRLSPGTPPAALRLAGVRLHALTGGNPLAVRHTLSDMGGPERLLHAGPGEPDGAADPPADALGGLLAQLTDTQRDVLVTDALLGETSRGAGIAEVLGLRPADVRDALAVARGLGLLRPAIDGSVGSHVHPAVAERLLDDLGEAGVCAAHARIATVLEQLRGASSFEVATHVLAACDHFDAAERARVAQEAADEAVKLYAFADADRFYAAAEGLADDDATLLRVLLARASARHRSGDTAGASELALRAARHAERLEEPDALAEAAVRYAYPPDWRAGDAIAMDLLERAEAAGPSPARLAEVLAARAVVEMRLPTRTTEAGQWGWLTRAAVAQPIADRAVALANRSGDPLARTRAMLAWRSTHRAPEHLERRSGMARVALGLAQRLRHLDLVVEAGARVATDAIEGCDPAAFDEACGLVAWAADRSQQPRLLWRAAVLDATRTGMARDVDGLHAALRRARQAAADGTFPGVHVAEVAIGFQLAMTSGDVAGLARMARNPEIPNHPLGAAGIALIDALTGNSDPVPRLVAQGVARLDRETSLLLTALLLGRAAVLVEDMAGVEALLPVLDPYRDRMGTDGDGLVFGGPVAGLTAAMRAMLGDREGAAADTRTAAAMHVRMGTTSANWVAPAPMPAVGSPLSEREQRVLDGMARGLRNADLAEDLHFSLATIRRETSAIFRKLGVTGRTEAVTEAHRLGLLDPEH